MKFPINIRQFLPHRKPMLMVDEITDLCDKFIETTFEIEPDNIFIEEGHFSETGVVENAAQTCSGIVGWPHFENNKDIENYKVKGFISKIDKVELFSLPPVNSTIITKGELVSMHQLGAIYNCKMVSTTWFKDTKIASCTFTLMMEP